MQNQVDKALNELSGVLPPARLVTDTAVVERYRHDRAPFAMVGEPVGVLLAQSTEDVVAALRWSHKWQVPVVPRGAGTGLSGGAAAIDGCLVLSLERMTAIREIDVREQVAVVEAGVLTADIDRAAQDHGLWYPPDPASFDISTIGGNLATNAGGLRCVKYGVTRDAVLGLEVALSGGRVIRTGGRTIKNVAGYDLTRLFVGSEGTLGVIISATLRLRPRPRERPVTFAVLFPTTGGIGHAVAEIFRAGLAPSLLEFLDQVTINAIEDYSPLGLDRDAAGLLIGQCDASDATEQVTAMCVCCEQAGASLVVASKHAHEGDMLVKARRLALPALERHGVTLSEDVGVPRGRLSEMLAAIDRIREVHDVHIATVGHAGDGNLHPTLVIPYHDAAAMKRARCAAEEICKAALLLGGTITGEHGVGLLKRPLLAAQLDEDTYAAHHAIKSALDPLCLLNPGKGI